MSITIILPQAVVPAAAASERALYLYYTHTKETGRIVFKRNGAYVQSGLNELNRFLRDWRRNEPAQMDPRLFDLVWEVYQEVGATQPINVVSAYRSPKTNEMLRATSAGVAENSQHTKGHAMDFFIPGVNLSKLRAVAMRKQVGGVGFYPTSGSPFVHLDTGSVRAWPRMTRAQLQEIFPDGRTMHVPTDGRPLSQQGYQTAMAEWKKCHAYPCNGSSSGTQVASAGNSGGNNRSLVDMLFGGKGQQAAAPAARQQAQAPVQMAAVAPQPAPTPALGAPVGASLAAPVPAMRSASAPSSNNASAPLEVASLNTPVAIPFSTTGSAPLDPSELASLTEPPVPARKSETLRVATASAIASNDAVTALASFNAPVPQSRLIMSNPPEAVTAYLQPSHSEGQQAIEAIQATAAVVPAQRPSHLANIGTDSIQTASLGGGGSANSYAGLFDNTFAATQQQGNNAAMAAALANHIASKSSATVMRPAELIAPDLEHVAEVFLTPVAMTSDHFAVIFDHDEADFDPSTTMGKFVTRMAVGDFPAIPAHNGFVIN